MIHWDDIDELSEACVNSPQVGEDPKLCTAFTVHLQVHLDESMRWTGWLILNNGELEVQVTGRRDTRNAAKLAAQDAARRIVQASFQELLEP